MHSEFEIEAIHARQILDSRGNPTLSAKCNWLGRLAMLQCPGASTGEHGAVERDGVPITTRQECRASRRFLNTTIAGELLGLDAQEQGMVDMLMLEADGTPNKSNFGANATLAAVVATARGSHAARYAFVALRWRCRSNVLPVPMFNILNGGKHADNTVDFQEFMVQPWGFDTFEEGLRCGVEIYHHLKKVLKEAGLSTAVGDEGGFAPNLAKTEDALELIAKTTESGRYSLGEQVFIAWTPPPAKWWAKPRSKAKRATASSRVTRPEWRPPTK